MAIPRLSKKPPRPAPFQRWRWGKPSPSPRGVLLAPEGPRLQHVHRVLRLRRCQCARKCLKYVTLPLVWLGAAREKSRHHVKYWSTSKPGSKLHIREQIEIHVLTNQLEGTGHYPRDRIPVSLVEYSVAMTEKSKIAIFWKPW